MKLRIFLPATDRVEASTRLQWMLFDSRHNLLREDATALADIPRGDDCELVLPASRVLFARLKLPRVNAAMIREMLPYAVEDRLLADPAHIHAVAGATDEHGETVVAVIDREWLQSIIDTLANAGIHVSRAWCESALLAGGHGDWNLVLGPAHGMLVDDDGIGVTFDREHTGDRDGASALPLALRIALDEAAARSSRPNGLRVHTDGDVALPDLERWSSETGVACARGSRWETLARGEPSADAIDLMAHGFSIRRRGVRGIRLPRAALALVAVIAVIQLGLTAIEVWRLSSERSSLEARREALFREAFPEAKVVVDPQLQMTRNLAEMRRTRGLASDDEFLAKLTEAARESATPVRSIEYANGRLDVRRTGPAIAEASK